MFETNLLRLLGKQTGKMLRKLFKINLEAGTKFEPEFSQDKKVYERFNFELYAEILYAKYLMHVFNKFVDTPDYSPNLFRRIVAGEKILFQQNAERIHQTHEDGVAEPYHDAMFSRVTRDGKSFTRIPSPDNGIELALYPKQ